MATPQTENGKATKAPKAEKAPKEQKEVVIYTINDKALSTDLGPRVIADLAKSYDKEQEANTLMQEVRAKRYDLMSHLTEAVVKASIGDKQIDLGVIFSGDKKKVGELNDKLFIALGVKEYEDIKGKQKLVYTQGVRPHFPDGTEKTKEEKQRKATLRSNFVHQLRKCTQAAVAINEGKIKTKYDKDAGTLRISGPAVLEQFGQKEVLLNEKQTVTVNKKGDTKSLKERPSFTALGIVAGKAHGAAVKGGKSNDRTRKLVVDLDAAIPSICASLVAALSKVEKLSAKMIASIESAQSAIDKALETKQG